MADKVRRSASRPRLEDTRERTTRPEPLLVDAFTARRESDATRLIFEYMAATLTEAGRAPPAGIDQLPPVLRDECQNLAAIYGLRQFILDVLPSRTHVIDFYRRLGYTETDPYPTESPVAMVYLQRPV